MKNREEPGENIFIDPTSFFLAAGGASPFVVRTLLCTHEKRQGPVNVPSSLARPHPLRNGAGGGAGAPTGEVKNCLLAGPDGGLPGVDD